MTADRPPTRCDTDNAAVALLRAALANPATTNAAATLKPPDADANWTPGPFELAWAIRQALPPGLAAADFDGVNIAAALG